jgi:TolA-binding protein
MKPTKQIVNKAGSNELASEGLSLLWIEYIKIYSKQIMSALLIILVLIAIILGWRYYRAGVEEKALILEYEAMASYREAGASEEKATELYTKALDGFNKVLSQYPGTKSGERALFYSANSHYLLGKYEEAISLFSEYTRKYPNGDFVTTSLKSSGYAYEQKGDYQKALETYQGIQDKVSSASDKTDLLLAIARGQEALGQNQEAIATYEKITSDTTLSPTLKKTAEDRMKALKARIE